MTTTPRAPTREIFGWAMFDFANSSFTTVIVTVVFSVIFPRLVVGDGPDYPLGNLLWSVALSVSYGLVVLTAPVLGAITDFRACKKRFLFGSYVLTVAAAALLYFVNPGHLVLGVVLVIVSNFGFAAGESFTSSFLPDLGPAEELGKISGFAWGLGYVGGIACTALVLAVVGAQTLENYDRVRWVGPITAAFFLIAAIPTFMFLHERGTAKVLPPGESLVGMGIRRLLETGRSLRSFRDLLVFFVAFFFAMAGLSIVISFAFIYGDQVIRWSPTSQMLMFVITNLTATVGAIGFGFLQQRWGNLRTFNLTLGIWMDGLDGDHRAVIGLAEMPLQDVLDRRKRHHLAAEFDEPLEASLERQAALGARRDQVPRAIPGLVFEGDKRRIARVVQVPAEHARPAHQQQAGFSRRGAPPDFEVHHGAFHRRHQPADGAGDGLVQGAHRHDG